MNNQSTQPSYWFARTDEKGAGPTYVVGRGDEEITHPCLFQHEAQAIVEALRAALAQGEQEPVKHWSDCAIHNAPAYPQGKCDCGGFPIAWFDPKGIHLEFDIEDCFSLQEKEGYQPLYTAPQQREWQGLTDEEMKQAYCDRPTWDAFAKDIERRLKEKNT